MTSSLPMGPERLYEGLDLETAEGRLDFGQRVIGYFADMPPGAVAGFAQRIVGRVYPSVDTNIENIGHEWMLSATVDEEPVRLSCEGVSA